MVPKPKILPTWPFIEDGHLWSTLCLPLVTFLPIVTRNPALWQKLLQTHNLSEFILAVITECCRLGNF